MVKKILARVFLSVVLLLMYAPILVLIVFSFTEATMVGDWTGFTFALYKEMWKNKEIMEALWHTILIALSASLCSTFLGTIGAIGIFYSKKTAKQALKGLNQIPVMNPEIVTAISLTILFVALGFEFNFFTLLVGHMVLTVPFVVLSVMPKLQQLNPNIYEAALDLGASPRRALMKVVIPEIMPGIFAGFLLSVTLSLDDYIITAFTRDNSFSTLSTYIYGVTAKRGALPPALRALTAVITFVMFCILLLINLKTKTEKKAIKRGVAIQ